LAEGDDYAVPPLFVCLLTAADLRGYRRQDVTSPIPKRCNVRTRHNLLVLANVQPAAQRGIHRRPHQSLTPTGTSLSQGNDGYSSSSMHLNKNYTTTTAQKSQEAAAVQRDFLFKGTRICHADRTKLSTKGQ